MKIIILALLIAVAFTASVAEKNGKLHFEADSNPELPFGLTMKGLINPLNEAENNLETFFRLAGELIPLAQSSMNDKQASNLQYSRQWCFGGGAGAAFSTCVNLNAELWVGWRVNLLGATGSFNVTYTPFTMFRAGTNVSASSFPAEVSYGGFFSIVDIQVPVNLLLAQTQICYSARFAMLPTAAYTAITTNLLQCDRSIPDQTNWRCDRVQGAEFRHLQWDITTGLFINLLPYTCFNF